MKPSEAAPVLPCPHADREPGTRPWWAQLIAPQQASRLNSLNPPGFKRAPLARRTKGSDRTDPRPVGVSVSISLSSRVIHEFLIKRHARDDGKPPRPDLHPRSERQAPRRTASATTARNPALPPLPGSLPFGAMSAERFRVKTRPDRLTSHPRGRTCKSTHRTDDTDA